MMKSFISMILAIAIFGNSNALAVCYQGNPLYPFQISGSSTYNGDGVELTSSSRRLDPTPRYDYTPSNYRSHVYVTYPNYLYFYPSPMSCVGGAHGSCARPGSSNADQYVLIAFLAVVAVVIVGYLVYWAYEFFDGKYDDMQQQKTLLLVSDVYDIPKQVTEYFEQGGVATKNEMKLYQHMKKAHGMQLKRLHAKLTAKDFWTREPKSNITIEELAQTLRAANENEALCHSGVGSKHYFGYREIKNQLLEGVFQKRLRSFAASH